MIQFLPQLLGLLPVLSFGLAGTWLLYREGRAPRKARELFLLATLLWGVQVTLFTEVLSLFHALSFWPVCAAWISSVLLFGAALVRAFLRSPRSGPPIRFVNYFDRRPDIALFAASALLFALLTLVAVNASPTNWDSMSYHMTRVVYWIQNGSLQHFPTHYPPQLFHPPWAEFAILQFQILTGDDHYASLIQIFSLLGACVTVSLIAKLFSADRWGQAITVVMVLTLPAVILQATNTQNDLAVSHWVAAFVYFLLSFLRGRSDAFAALIVGASLGLALLTKSTAYLYCFPFCVWLGCSLMRGNLRRAISVLCIVGSTSLFLNAGFYFRNLQSFGSPLGAPQAWIKSRTSEVHSPRFVLSTLVRNGVMQLDLPGYLGFSPSFLPPVPALAHGVSNVVHRFLSVDESDPRTTTDQFSVPGFSFNEDTATNPLHFAILVLALIAMPASVRKYGFAVVGSFVLFCAVIKWEIFNPRLHIPYFILLSPLVGCVATKRKAPWLVVLPLVSILFVVALKGIWANPLRPLGTSRSVLKIDRTAQFFVGRKWLEEPLASTTAFLRAGKCKVIGLQFNEDFWEYPVHKLLKSGGRQFELRHVNVTDITFTKHRDSLAGFHPCFILAFEKNATRSRTEIELDGIKFVKGRTFYPYAIYAPPPSS